MRTVLILRRLHELSAMFFFLPLPLRLYAMSHGIYQHPNWCDDWHLLLKVLHAKSVSRISTECTVPLLNLTRAFKTFLLGILVKEYGRFGHAS